MSTRPMANIYRAILFSAILFGCFAFPLAGALRAAEITSATILGNEFNPGDTVVVSFMTDGPFDPGNVFTLQVSSLNGSFAQARPIGVLPSQNFGTILGKLPCDLNEGTGYRVRVVASSPAAIGPDNGAPLTIRSRIPVMITPSGPTTICQGDSVTLSGDAGFKTYRWNTGDTTRSIVARSSGIYTLTATDTNDCGLVSRATITVRPNPQPRLDVKREGDEALLSTDSVPRFAAYQWEFREAGSTTWTPLTGETNPSLNVMVADPGRNGWYRVRVADANGCMGISDSFRLQEGDVEWTRAADAGVKIYPQPTRDRVTVEMKLERTATMTITVNDMTGRELLRFDEGRVSGEYRQEIPMEQLPAGSYLLRIEIGDRRLVEKIVKSAGGR